MRSKLLYTVFITVLTLNLSFSQVSLWNLSSESRTKNLEKSDRAYSPSEYTLYELNLNSFKTLIQNAPLDLSFEPSNVIVEFPSPDGELQHFRIFEAPIMETGLSSRYPGINSYVGKGIEDPTASIRFSITLFGLHAMYTSGDKGTYYIDTYTKDQSHFIVYNRKNILNQRAFTCLTQPTEEEAIVQRSGDMLRASDGVFRQYRLAMACTIEYAAFHVNAAGLSSGTLAQKKSAVLSAMVVTMTRVNGIYERDNSLRMNLVANNDAVIFIDSDSFTNDNANSLINESQTVIDTNIGTANYDIGHTVSTGGGGLAQLNSPCTTSKARGITGSSAPVGDAYDVDYVAHEMGHQFGGTHSFNNSCSSNRTASTAVEPGSGSTIMAYAGICTPNVQSNSDAHFHAVNIAQISTFIAGTGNCSANTANGNSAPVVNSGGNWTIPLGTPFILTGSATDANNDALTYCWEQTNAQISTQPPAQTSTTGPNFKSNPPASSPSRYLPAIENVINNNLAPTWEVIPNVARTMNFALTVRDNRTPNGGQTGRADMILTVSSVGPFNVTSQNTETIWAPGSSQTVTWAVNSANTLTGATNVNILLSTDGGFTYPTTLLSNVPNNGSATITVPNITAANCRVMVKPTGNIFYDINEKNIAIGNYTYQTQTVCTNYPFTLNSTITEDSTTSYPGLGLTISDSYTITDANFYANVTHPNIGQFSLLIKAPWQTSLNTAIWYNNLTCTSANMNKWFDTAGSAVNCANVNNNTTPFLPYSVTNINGYNGNNSAGSWLIYFKDTVVDSNVSAASFNSFTINLCKSVQVPVLLNETFGLDNFTIYPNPNNGSFTVQFNADATNDIKISAHDLRGRQVFSNSFDKSNIFNQNIELTNIQSGIYLITVENGSKKEVKKIIVE